MLGVLLKHTLELPEGNSTLPSGEHESLESTIVYWGYIGIMEKKMETTISGLGYIVPLK